MSYFQFYKNYYSANGEDGIIDQLFEDLGINRSESVVCEFWKHGMGLMTVTVFHQWLRGAHGILIEGLESRFNELVYNTKGFKTTCIQSYGTGRG